MNTYVAKGLMQGLGSTGMLQPWRVWEGAGHMGQFNAGMGQDTWDICVRAINDPPSKLCTLLTLVNNCA
jgi:hypothetical protein